MFTAVLFVSYLTNMGLPVAVARFGTRPKREFEPMWGWAVLYTTATSFVGALLGVAIIAGVWGQPLASDFVDLPVVAQFVLVFLVVGGLALSTLVEQRLVAQRLGVLLVLRVSVVVLIRIPLLLVIGAAAGSVGLLLLMGGVLGLSGYLGVVAFAVVAGKDNRRLRPLPDWAPAAFRFAGVNWLSSLAAQAPVYLVPLVVARAVSSTNNAAFYLAWTVTMVSYLVPLTIGQVVLAEGSRQPVGLSAEVRRGLVLAVGVTLGMTVGAFALAPLSTTVFGSDYELTGDVLPPLIAASMFWSITAMLIARARALDSNLLTISITVMFALVSVGSVVWGLGGGSVVGAARGWFFGNVVAAVGAVLASTIVFLRARAGR